MITFICPKHGPVPDEEVAHESQSEMPYHGAIFWTDAGRRRCGADLRISELDDKTREAMRKVGIGK